MFSLKKTIRFCWLLPSFYLAVLIVYFLGMVSGAGHVPHIFDPLFHIIVGLRYVIDLIIPRG